MNQILKIFFISMVLLSLAGCTNMFGPYSNLNDPEASNYNGSFNLAPGENPIGAKGPAGGLICYYDTNGFTVNGITCHYLEAAPSDTGFALGWREYNYPSISTGTAIGSGAANTAAIIANQGVGYFAASLCKSYDGGGKSDWFLPSKDELNQIYINLKVRGVNSFDGDYWSSSQGYDYVYVWIQNLDDGKQSYSNTDPGNDVCYARPVRAF